jgi:hypothetical protein
MGFFLKHICLANFKGGQLHGVNKGQKNKKKPLSKAFKQEMAKFKILVTFKSQMPYPIFHSQEANKILHKIGRGGFSDLQKNIFSDQDGGGSIETPQPVNATFVRTTRRR